MTQMHENNSPEADALKAAERKQQKLVLFLKNTRRFYLDWQSLVLTELKFLCGKICIFNTRLSSNE